MSYLQISPSCCFLDSPCFSPYFSSYFSLFSFPQWLELTLMDLSNSLRLPRGQQIKVSLMPNFVFFCLVGHLHQNIHEWPWESVQTTCQNSLLLSSKAPLLLSAVFHHYLLYVVLTKVLSPKSFCDVFHIYSLFYFPTKSLYVTISIFMNRALSSYLSLFLSWICPTKSILFIVARTVFIKYDWVVQKFFRATLQGGEPMHQTSLIP